MEPVQSCARARKFCGNSRANAVSQAELHKNSACGKAVHGVCTPVNPFAHFSLAQVAPIGDNPALSDSSKFEGPAIP
jgi:hypothetical protein